MVHSPAMSKNSSSKTTTSPEVNQKSTHGNQKVLGDLNGAFNKALAEAASTGSYQDITRGGTSFETVHNYSREIDTIAEEYISYLSGLYEAMGKEGIQNCVDAATTPNFLRFKIMIELRKSRLGDPYVSITDEGTHGLTGRWPKNDEDYFSEDPDERMSRFMSHGFGKAGPNANLALGGRGRGKCLLVACSQIKEICLETAFGARHIIGRKYVDKSHFPTDLEDNPLKVQAFFKAFDPTLRPITGGTRIMITKVKDQIINAIQMGMLARSIGLCWFDLIKRFDLNIVINDGNGPKRVKIPEDYAFPDKDTDNLVTYKVANVPLVQGNGAKHSFTLHLVHSKKPIKEDIRGIALVRGGMVIKRLPVSGPTDIAGNIYGYVRMSPSLEAEMRKLEHPTHCDFDLTRGVGIALRRMVEGAVQEFIRSKLGVGAPEGDNANLAAANRAVSKMAKVFTLLHLKLPTAGRHHKSPTDDPTPKEPPTVSIKVDGLQYPNDNNRINYGQALKWNDVIVANETDQKLAVQCIIEISSLRDQPVGISTCSLILEPHQTITWAGVTKGKKYVVCKAFFPPGHYYFTKRVVLAEAAKINGEHRDVGSILQNAKRNLWIAEDEPVTAGQGGLPEITMIAFEDDVKHLEYRLRKTPRDVLELNTKHPSYLRAVNIKDEKAKTDSTMVYTFDRLISAIIEIALGTPDCDLTKTHLKSVGADGKPIPADLLFKATQELAAQLRTGYTKV